MNVPVQYVDASYVDASGIPMGSCPASVDMDSGLISINRSVWDRYDRFEKNFILWHEIGHYELDTDSEYEADEYALQHVYKTAPRSLKRALQTLYKIRVVDGSRLDHLYRVALTLDAADGNGNASLELQNIEYFNKPKNQKVMTNTTANETYLAKRTNKNRVRVVRRANGDENINEKSHKTNGIKLGGMYFSFTNILLMILIAVVLFKK